MEFHCIEATVDMERPFGFIRLWLNRTTPFMEHGRDEALIVSRFLNKADISDLLIEGDAAAHAQLVDFLKDLPDINAFQIILKGHGTNGNTNYGMMYYTVPFSET